jgi:hypothetical protein
LIISRAYPSDDNDLLQNVQHALYSRHVFELFDAARQAMVWAADVLNADLLVAEKARTVERFDHRVLQDAHDIMAASFRHKCDVGERYRLPEGERDLREHYRLTWHTWFTAELETLAKSPNFVRSVVQTVLLTNTELGYAAERDVCALLIARFGMDDWGFADGYVKAYRLRA